MSDALAVNSSGVTSGMAGPKPKDSQPIDTEIRAEDARIDAKINNICKGCRRRRRIAAKSGFHRNHVNRLVLAGAWLVFQKDMPFKIKKEKTT
jgi:hypothetical protein